MHWPHPSTWTWEFINSFAPWFSAIGTIAAVVTSLYLARERTKLLISAKPIPEKYGEFYKNSIGVQVINLRGETAHVDTLYWKIGPFWRRRTLLQNPEPIAYGKVSATKLSGFQALDYVVTKTALVDLFMEPASRAVLLRRPRKLVRINVGVITLTKKRFEAPVDASVRDWIFTVVEPSTK